MKAIDFIKKRQNNVLLEDYSLQDMEWFMTEFAKEYYTEQSKLFGVGVTLPNIYEGSLNSKRIKEIDTIVESYNVDKSTIRRVFCDGADWYKKQLKDSGN